MVIGEKILLLGHTGQVGRELERILHPYGQLVTSGRHSGDCPADLCNQSEVASLLANTRPATIVNAAAYTAVDLAEKEPEMARRLNQELPAQLAEFAAAQDAELIHYSTDYVFSGQSDTPYVEADHPAPIGVYGASKLAGEDAIRQSACRHLIFRTAWVYSNYGKNFLKTILKLASQRDELAVVNDQFGTPTWARSLAQLTVAAIGKQSRIRSGTFHLSSTGEPVSWHGFALELISQAAPRLERIPEVKQTTSREYPTAAERPAYSVLDNSAFQNRFGLRVPHWRRQLKWCLEDLF